MTITYNATTGTATVPIGGSFPATPADIIVPITVTVDPPNMKATEATFSVDQRDVSLSGADYGVTIVANGTFVIQRTGTDNGGTVHAGATGDNEGKVTFRIPTKTAATTHTFSVFDEAGGTALDTITFVQSAEDVLKNATVFIYRRHATALTTSPGTSTYTFATGVLSDVPANWSTDIPSGTDPIYRSTGVAVSTGATDEVTWSNPVLFTKDGDPGTAGRSVEFLQVFARGGTAPSLPDTTVTFASGEATWSAPTGWYKQVSSIPSGNTGTLWLATETAASVGDGTDTVTWDEGISIVDEAAVDTQVGASISVESDLIAYSGTTVIGGVVNSQVSFQVITTPRAGMFTVSGTGAVKNGNVVTVTTPTTGGTRNGLPIFTTADKTVTVTHSTSGAAIPVRVVQSISTHTQGNPPISSNAIDSINVNIGGSAGTTTGVLYIT